MPNFWEGENIDCPTQKHGRPCCTRYGTLLGYFRHFRHQTEKGTTSTARLGLLMIPHQEVKNTCHLAVVFHDDATCHHDGISATFHEPQTAVWAYFLADFVKKRLERKNRSCLCNIGRTFFSNFFQVHHSWWPKICFFLRPDLWCFFHIISKLKKKVKSCWKFTIPQCVGNTFWGLNVMWHQNFGKTACQLKES